MRGKRPSTCRDCRHRGGGDWLSKSQRLRLYERDEWRCGICGEDVDRTLMGSRSPWRPSADHIVPRARGGSNEMSNLRLAHFWCNAVRGDERAYTDEDFKVAS